MDNLAEQEKQNAEAQRPEGSEAPFDFDREFTEALGQENPASDGAESPEGQVHSESQGEVEAQQGGTEPQSPSSLLAQRLGLDPSRYQSDDEAVEAVRKTLEIREQERQALEVSRQQIAQYQAYLSQLQQAQLPTPQPQAEVKQSWWNPPAYNEEQAKRWLTKNDQGEVVWKDNTPAEIRKQAEDYLDYQENFRRKLFTNPEEALAPMLETRDQKLYQKAKQDALQEFQATQTERMVQEELKKYAPHFVERDALGQEVRDPYTGSVKLNSVGQAFQNYDNFLLQHNITDPKTRLEACIKHVQGDLAVKILNERQGQVPTQAQPASPSPAEQQKRALLQRAVRQPNRSGSVPQTPSGPAQNPNLRAADMLLQEMQREGIDYRQALTRN